MRTGVLVQVRLDSRRLPGKAFAPLAGDTVIGHVMRALALVPADARALATDGAGAAALASAAEAGGFLVLAGPSDDVLARFCAAARELSLGRIVRATGDNPLVCPRLARLILDTHERERADLSHFLGNPWGTGVEIIETAALEEAEREARLPEEREHITTWLYRHRERFTVVEQQAPEACWLPEARVTVDTAEDLALVRSLFADLYQGVPLEADAVVRWWLDRHGGSRGPADG